MEITNSVDRGEGGMVASAMRGLPKQPNRLADDNRTMERKRGSIKQQVCLTVSRRKATRDEG